LFPDAWSRYLAPIPPEERGDLLQAYHRRLTGSDEAAKAEAATAWSQWEGDTISIRGPEGRPAKFGEVDFAIAFARIECHYFVNRGFFPEDGWILKNAHRLADIPGWIVQGRYDVVTPLETAWALKSAWPKANFEVVWDAGHASTEPGIIDALVRASEAALRL
ncbi:MAG: prolyl aminopeptidase, partial [Phenylobacterium sp.]